jgi:hypothetical protein
MTKTAGSGSISQRHGSAGPDPDPHQNVMDPQTLVVTMYLCLSSLAGDVDHNHDLASILLQFHGNTINSSGLKLVYRPGTRVGHGLM